LRRAPLHVHSGRVARKDCFDSEKLSTAFVAFRH
jgi:hypothetical protein